MPRIVIDSQASHQPLLAASSYLNTAPLIWSFLKGSRQGQIDFREAVPAECARLLSRGAVDGALTPVIEYQRINDVKIVPNVCVGSRQRVRSVVLATRKHELKDIRSVAIDDSSRTSAALIRIIFREFLGFEPEWSVFAPDVESMLEKSDAALIIGDPAMTFSRDNLSVFDLASLWRKFTGLGFVFAVWLIRDKANPATRSIDFAGARDEGLKERLAIVRDYEPALNLPREELEEYLSENISFTIEPDMQEGLELYFKLAYKHALIETNKPLALL